MNPFIYNIPTKVYFGENQLGNLGAELRKFGKRVLVTYGGGSIKRIGLYDKVMEELRKADMEVFELSGIEPNPRIESVREGARICKEHNVDVLLAVGGGSTLDATKFMAAVTEATKTTTTPLSMPNIPPKILSVSFTTGIFLTMPSSNQTTTFNARTNKTNK